MDTSKAKKTATKKSETTERKYIMINSIVIPEKNVRVVSGKNGDMVFFTLVLNGVTIYNCRVATGKNGDFISFPQNKGKDGKYYSVAYAPISPESEKKILSKLQDILDNQSGGNADVEDDELPFN